jgi:hypothetical protein
MSAPTDLELMMYFDGELEEPRRSDVEAWLAASTRATDASAQAAGKLASLDQVSLFVRDSALANPPSAAYDVASVVMASIAQDAAALDEAHGANGLANGAAKKTVEATKPPPSDVVRPISSAKKAASTPRPDGAANDNGRFIFGVAAIAAVAAAAMFFWGRSTGPSTAENLPAALPPATEQAAQAPTALEPLGALPPATATSSDRVEAEPESSGVEVASVDFGSRSGAIYYVSGASQGATTAVVWLSDE